MGQKKPTVFAREATGLVRSISPYSAVVFCIANTGYLFFLFFAITVAPGLGTETDLLGGAILATIATIFITFVWYYFVLIAPRTGGDYVWLTRWLHPLIGFISTVVGVVFVEMLYIGLTGVTIQSTGLSIALATMGSLLHNQGMLAMASSITSQTNILFLGTLEIWIPALFVLLGTRLYFKAQNAVYLFVFLIMAVLFGIMATTTPSQFAPLFNSYAQGIGSNSTNYYQQIIDSAKGAGWAPPTSSVMNMFLIMPLLIPTVAFTLLSYVGGEVKNTRKTWAIGLFGGSLSFSLFTALGILLAYHAFGFEFLSALYYNLYVNPSALIFPALPYLNYLAAIAVGGSPVLIVLLALSFVQSIWYQPAATMVTSRAFFAFSFDRLAPEKLSSVDNRWRSPIYAVILTLIGSELMLFFFVLPFTASYAYLFVGVALLIAFLTPYWLLGLTAVIFPFRFKSIYEASAAKASIAGLPNMVWAGLGTLIFTTISIYLLLTQSAYGANSPAGLELVGGAIIVSIVLFFIARAWRSRQGLDLKYVYGEIPPE
jgi:amino acid transporter